MSIQDNEFENKMKSNRLYEYAKPFFKAYCNIIGQRCVLPDFLILGVAKGGTTSLYQYLSQHPGVIPISGKEVYFFDKNFHMGVNWYRKFFPSKKIMKEKSKELGYDVLTGEATPRYIHYPHAPKRVHNIIPTAKFIVLLRNPIDRAYSHWNMRWGKKKETLSFDEAINSETQRLGNEFEKMGNDNNYYSSDYFHHAYLERGIYVDKLKHWMSIFPREKFLIIQSEKLFENPQQEYDKVLSFFGLSKWKLKDTRPKGSREYEKPQMTSEIRKQLSEFYKPHNERLFEFLGTKFDWN